VDSLRSHELERARLRTALFRTLPGSAQSEGNSKRSEQLLYAVGPLLLLIAIVSSIPKVEFVRNSVASDGTIIGLQSVYSRRFSKEVYKPVVRFTDSNGQTHLFLAVSRAGLVPLKPGDSVRVLYLKDHPETARVDSIAQLWMPQPILALIGAVFVAFSVRILIRRKYRGHASVSG
jgi:hypothetical protein